MNIIEKILNNLDEKPLTPSQRRARGRIMKRLAPKIALKRKIAMKKKASPEKIAKRAEKQAKEIIRNKILKDKKYQDLDVGQKTVIDKKVAKKKAAIKKIAKKLLPKVKKQEKIRLAKMQDKKESNKIQEIEKPTTKAAYDFKDIHGIEVYDGDK